MLEGLVSETSGLIKSGSGDGVIALIVENVLWEQMSVINLNPSRIIRLLLELLWINWFHFKCLNILFSESMQALPDHVLMMQVSML